MSGCKVDVSFSLVFLVVCNSHIVVGTLLTDIGSYYRMRRGVFDTIAGVWGPPLDFDVSVFDGVTTSRRRNVDGRGTDSENTRYYTVVVRNTQRVPALTYYPMTRAGSRLKFEVSLPKLLGLPVAVLSQADVERGLDLIDKFIHEKGIVAPAVREWRCVRLDVTYMWNTAADTPIYIVALANQQIGNYVRVPYGTGGVTWKAGKGYRWVKFYDKLLEQGLGKVGGVLRFEVSNYSGGVRDIVRRLRCGRTVGNLCTAAVACSELLHWLGKLGVNEHGFGARDVLQCKLVEVFGTRGAPQALFFLEQWSRHGLDVYKEPLSLMTSATFYRWRRKLEQAGLLVSVDTAGGLPPLSLPNPEEFGLFTMGGGWGFHND